MTEQGLLRVVIADDEPLVREGLRLVLEHEEGVRVVAEASDGAEAVAHVSSHVPDVALVDIRMPRIDGIEATRRITADPRLARVRVVVLTTFAADDLVAAAVRAGAAGYLLKSMPPAQIRLSVRAAAQGQTPLAPQIAGRLLRDHADRRQPRSAELDRLTPREIEVLRGVAAGRSNAEIASSLHLGTGTVKSHVAAILHKLGLRDRTQAAVAAYELGLVLPEHRGRQ